jgi:hypothetical protein
LKRLPAVIASADRDLGVEIIAFDGADRIPNRDAVGFYFHVRLQPSGELSRVAVLFSGTVMAVRPEAFGLPTLGDREETFRTLAETAIGDFLDSDGLPAFTPSGAPATTIDCFSPHFQGWKDRPPSSDDRIEQYLFAQVLWARKYGHPSWTLGPSDLLRLNRPLPDVLCLVRRHEGEAWNLKDESSAGVTLVPVASFLRQRAATQPTPSSPAAEPPSVQPELLPPTFVYVDEARIADLRTLEADFDFRKLIALCQELNQCYRAQCYHAVAALTRALIDHVPPVFGFSTFGEVVNNYAGTRSFKDCMRQLDEMARKIADTHLHTVIRDSEVLPTRVQVDSSQGVDVLLAEVIRRLQPKPRRNSESAPNT